MSNDILLNIKKRNRPSLVCIVCKKRKIRCDKGKPCSSCVKNQIEHLCQYSEAPGITKRQPERSPQDNGHSNDHLVYIKKQYLDDLTSQMENLQELVHHQQQQQQIQPQPQPQLDVSHHDAAYSNIQLNNPVLFQQHPPPPPPYSHPPPVAPYPQQNVVPPYFHPPQIPNPPYSQQTPHLQPTPTQSALPPPPPPPRPRPPSFSNQHLPFPAINLATTPISQYPPLGNHQYPLPTYNIPLNQFTPFLLSPGNYPQVTKLQGSVSFVDIRSHSLSDIEPSYTNSSSCCRPNDNNSGDDINNTATATNATTNTAATLCTAPITLSSTGPEVSESSASKPPANNGMQPFVCSVYNQDGSYTNRLIENERLAREFCGDNCIRVENFDVQVHPFCEMSSSQSDMHRYISDLKSVMPKCINIRNLNKLREVSGSIGINPYTSPEEVINFHKGFNPIIIELSGRRSCGGPLSWINLKRKDYAARLIDKRVKLAKVEQEKTAAAISLPQGINSTDSKDHHHKEQASSQKDSTTTPTSIEAKTIKEEKQAAAEKGKANIAPSSNRRVLTLDLTLNMTHIGEESKWTDIIQKVIPKRRTIWTLLDLYFNKVYAYFPYIDELKFKARLYPIIGPCLYVDEIPKVKIEERVDLAYIGTLFCLLRLTYLHVLPSDDLKLKSILESDNSDVNKYVLENPIPITLIDVTAACIEHFLFVRKLCLPVFQCCWFYRLYQIHAPEDGECSDPAIAQVAHSILVSVAFAIGLNREPSLISGFALTQKEAEELKDERTRNLCRKLWYSLLFVDHQQVFNEGCYPLRLTSADHDVMLPRLLAGGSNSTNIELEKQVMQVYALWDMCADGPIPKILQLVLPMNQEVKVHEIMKLLSLGEIGVLNAMGTFDDFLVVNPEKHPSVVVRVGTLSLLMFAYSVFLSLYLVFMVHYNEKSNNAMEYFYIQKLFQDKLINCFPYFLKLVYEIDNIYGNGAGMMLFPQIITMIVRTIECLFLIITRANLYLFSNSKKEKFTKYHKENIYRASKILKYSEKVARILLFALTKLVTKYYIAWKNYKSLLLVLDMITKESFYADKDPLMDHLGSQIPLYESSNLCDICDKSFEKFLQVSETIKELDLHDLLEKITRSSAETQKNWEGGGQTNHQFDKSSSMELEMRKDDFNGNSSSTSANTTTSANTEQQHVKAESTMVYSSEEFPATWNRNYTEVSSVDASPLKQRQTVLADYGRQSIGICQEQEQEQEETLNQDIHNENNNHSGTYHNDSIPVVVSDYQNIPIDNGEAIDSRWLQMDTLRKTKTTQFDSLGPFSGIGGYHRGMGIPFQSDMHNDDFIDQIYTNRYMLVDVESLGRQADGPPFTNGITSELNAELFTDMA